MEFEWYELKNQINRKKHGISFEEVKIVFDDPDHSQEEERFLIIGMSDKKGGLHCQSFLLWCK